MLYNINRVYLHCVFHGIRFKVNKDWVSGIDALLFFIYLPSPPNRPPADARRRKEKNGGSLVFLPLVLYFCKVMSKTKNLLIFKTQAKEL